MFIKGKIKAEKDRLSLIKVVLEGEGLKVEEDENVVYFEQDVDPLYFSRTRAYQIFEKLKNLEVQEIDLGAYSIVEIYHYKYENGEVETHD